MVGSDPGEASRAAMLERDEIMTTKVKIPHLRPGCLNRPRLVHALDEAVLRDLTLVCTPAGFGKTTLLADWAQGADVAVAWLSLDEDDSDPTRFWRYVLASLERAIDLDESVPTLVANPGGASSQGLSTAFIHELESLNEDLVLVLDDYHNVDTVGIHDGMSFLLGHQPARLHVVVSTRVDPPLPVAKLRASNQLAELRAADLRFSQEESKAFMEEVWGLEVSRRTADALQARTEGWAVGLQLAALSLKDRPDREAFIEAFTGTHRYVLDYLTEEVFDVQPEPIKEFLLKTSVLARLNSQLCNEVTGHTDGQTMLEELDRANLFLVPLDEDRHWYRFHRLFADLLLSRLQQTDPESVPELHRRAGNWCANHGLVDDAIRHAFSAEDPQWAADLVERHVEELLLRRSERATLDRWLAALPAEIVEGRTRLIVAQAIAAQIEGRLDDSERLLSAALKTEAEPEAPHDPSVGREASVLANLAGCTPIIQAELARLAGDPDRAAAFANDALPKLTADDRLLSTFARYHLSVADWMLGRLESAEQGLSRVVEEREVAGERYLAVRASYDLGAVRQAWGRLGAALQTYRRAEEIMTEHGGRPRPETGLAMVGIAEVLRERGDLSGALGHATDAVQMCRQLVYTPPLAIGLVTLAWIHHAMGHADRAREVMEEARHVVPSANVAPLLNPAPAAWAHLALAQGRVEEAIRWAEELGVSDADEISYPFEPRHLVFARILLARDLSDRALRLIQRLDDLADSQGRRGSLIRIRALETLMLEATGDRDGALALLADTLSMASTEGYVRVFVDEGQLMAPLLRGLSRAGQETGPSESRGVIAYRNRVLRAFQLDDESADGEVMTVGLPHPLTDRELEVLRLVAAGMRNREIAGELWVTVDTVKKHVSHILDKLAATNRTEAVAEAVDLGILDLSD